MVRRSLMLVRNMQVIEPSADFRQRMQARLAETRAETQRERFAFAEREANGTTRSVRQPIVLSAVAAGVMIMGSLAYRQVSAPEPTMARAQPTAMVIKPVEPPSVDTMLQPIYLTPGMVQALATGNPMWPAALLVDDAPAQIINAEFTTVKALRD
ncbi:MAG: hypothetical protein ABJB74_14825 [Gemmatimonas sp.]